jgi:catechol 2,3-dioxygenase-like lactoylglutathione lyase family enzyme
MLDHLGIPVIDYARSKAFYLKALAPLGHGLIMEVTPEQTGDGYAGGFGSDGKPAFWIGEADTVGTGVHVALTAGGRAAVDAFYQAALAAGATDNGGPGLRPHYHPDYYAAFVRDPDGHNIEAVCHSPAG